MGQILVKLESVGKQYNVQSQIKKALDKVTLDVHSGEILALLGVNGAGKTTLSTILAGLHPPSFGDIKYKGKSIYEDIVSYRKIVGFCPQKPNLDLSLTLEENLIFAGRYHLMSPRDIRSQSERLMEHFHLYEFAKSRAYSLSGGYKQRFLIARTLMHRPKLIILDEFTVGLDPAIRHELWEEISALKQTGVAIVLTTHYLDEAEQVADRVCIIDAGTIKTVDTPQNLMNLHQKVRLEDVFIKLTKEFQYVEQQST